MEKETKTFTDVSEAFDYLVNVAWKSLTPKQRKELRYDKTNFNHNTVSNEKMEEILSRYGTLKKNVEFTLK